MKESKTYNRSKLLRITSDMGYSTFLRHEIMLIIGNIKGDSLKEEMAKQAIPIVEQAATEQEALNRIRKLIEQA